MVRIKPRHGVKVRHPVTGMHIPEDGLEVSELDTYWVRRLRDRDVVVEPESVMTKPVEPAPAQKKRSV